MEALSLLRDVTAAPPRHAAAPEPTRRQVRYCTAAGMRTGDLYIPDRVDAGLVVVPGVARAGKDDPRLVAFARSLARARFVVLVPDIANLRELKVSPEDTREVAEGVRHLAGQIPNEAEARVGLVAISYAVGPAILAAREEDTRARVRFVLAIGGYYDIQATVTFFTTGFFRERDEWRYQEPNAYGKWLFVRANAEHVADLGDRTKLVSMAERKLADPTADVDDLVQRLESEGQRINDLLANRDPEAVPKLIAALPAQVRANLIALDPKQQGLSRLDARLFLIHGRDDRIIPYSESEALHAAAHPGTSELYLVDSLAHVDLTAAGVPDILRLWRATYRLLGERDTMAAPVPTGVVHYGTAPLMPACASHGQIH